MSSRTWSARFHAELGTFPEGVAVGEEGIRIAETIDYSWDLAQAYDARGRLALRQGDIDQAIAMFERSLAIHKAAQIPFRFPIVAASLAVAYALAGRSAEALQLIEHVVEQVDHERIGPALLIALTDLSEAYLLLGRLENASRLAERSLAIFRDQKQRGTQAWALRLSGEIAMRRDPPEVDQAETHYQQALSLADELGMRPLQAHCQRGLGTLYGQTGQAEQARAELSTAIEMYRDMEMTFWLPETETALADVEAR